MSYHVIEEGIITYEPQFEKDRKYIPEGKYPRRYWDILIFDSEEEQAAYLASQEPDVEPEPEPMRRCQDCKRPCKARFKQCYRCYQFAQKKARIMKDLSA